MGGIWQLDVECGVREYLSGVMSGQRVRKLIVDVGFIFKGLFVDQSCFWIDVCDENKSVCEVFCVVYVSSIYGILLFVGFFGFFEIGIGLRKILERLFWE